MTSTGLRDRAAELLRLAELATPGPWFADPVKGYTDDYIRTKHPDYAPSYPDAPHRNYVGETGLGTGQKKQNYMNDSAFIVAARNDAPDIIRALLASPAPAGAEGWVLVPKEATREMAIAAHARDHDGTTSMYHKIWAAMVAASPAPAQATPPAEAREPATEELKPCPFCGGAPRLHEHRTERGLFQSVGCENEACSVAETYGQLNGASIKQWNTRATPAPALVEPGLVVEALNAAKIARKMADGLPCPSGERTAYLHAARVIDNLLAALPGAATEKDDTQKQEPT